MLFFLIMATGRPTQKILHVKRALWTSVAPPSARAWHVNVSMGSDSVLVNDQY